MRRALIFVGLLGGLIVAGSVWAVWFVLSSAHHDSEAADRCREAGGTLVETVDASNGSICARLEVIQP